MTERDKMKYYSVNSKDRREELAESKAPEKSGILVGSVEQVKDGHVGGDMTERKKFEAWFLSLDTTNDKDLKLMPKSESGLDTLYKFSWVEKMWQAWQGRAAQDVWVKFEDEMPVDKAPIAMIGLDVAVGTFNKYTTDPYCGWVENGGYVRWPHPFNPTHWKYVDIEE